MAHPISKIARTIVKLFEPPQIDGYLIITDLYGYTHGSGGYTYPILIKVDNRTKKHENVPGSPAAPTPFKAVIKTMRQRSSSSENPDPIIFHSKITPKG